jgi:predicted GIY-YIG superfamily endonuclease
MTQLYRHYDADKNLMYVGISLNAFARLSQHRDHSKWFEKIAHVEIEHFPTREEALAAEKNAIKSENPMFNIASRKTMKELKEEEKIIEEKRKKEFIHRTVHFSLAHRLDDLRGMLNMTRKELELHVAHGNLSVFYVESVASWKTKEVRSIPMVSGWSLIDFICFLESKAVLNELH